MRSTINFDPSGLDWEKGDGLIPAVVQDSATLSVLMLGYMNRQSLDKTIETRLVTFYSRSRESLWTKGETSGNVLHVDTIEADCDNDTVLVMATPKGPTCHRGTTTCFDDEVRDARLSLYELERIIDARIDSGDEGSYTRLLVESGVERIAQKVGEEAVESVIASLGDNDESFLDETADLVYHLLVLIRNRGLRLSDIEKVLSERHHSS